MPHRPTKGLSDRPLETFGRKYFVLFLKCQVTVSYAFIVRARGGAVKVGEDTKKPKAKPSVSGAPSGARTLGTLIKSQVTFFRALMKQRNAAHFCFCGFYVDMAVNLQGQF